MGRNGLAAMTPPAARLHLVADMVSADAEGAKVGPRDYAASKGSLLGRSSVSSLEQLTWCHDLQSLGSAVAEGSVSAGPWTIRPVTKRRWKSARGLEEAVGFQGEVVIGELRGKGVGVAFDHTHPDPPKPRGGRLAQLSGALSGDGVIDLGQGVPLRAHPAQFGIADGREHDPVAGGERR